MPVGNDDNSAISCDRVRHPGSEHVHCPEQGKEAEGLREQRALRSRALGLHRTKDVFSTAWSHMAPVFELGAPRSRPNPTRHGLGRDLEEVGMLARRNLAQILFRFALRSARYDGAAVWVFPVPGLADSLGCTI